MSLIQLVIERARGLLGGGRVREQTFAPTPRHLPPGNHHRSCGLES